MDGDWRRNSGDSILNYPLFSLGPRFFNDNSHNKIYCPRKSWDYKRMARVVTGLAKVTAELACLIFSISQSRIGSLSI